MFNLKPDIVSQLKTERNNKDPKQTKTWKTHENERMLEPGKPGAMED